MAHAVFGAREFDSRWQMTTLFVAGLLGLSLLNDFVLCQDQLIEAFVDAFLGALRDGGCTLPECQLRAADIDQSDPPGALTIAQNPNTGVVISFSSFASPARLSVEGVSSLKSFDVSALLAEWTEEAFSIKIVACNRLESLDFSPLQSGSSFQVRQNPQLSRISLPSEIDSLIIERNLNLTLLEVDVSQMDGGSFEICRFQGNCFAPATMDILLRACKRLPNSQQSGDVCRAIHGRASEISENFATGAGSESDAPAAGLESDAATAGLESEANDAQIEAKSPEAPSMEAMTLSAIEALLVVGTIVAFLGCIVFGAGFLFVLRKINHLEKEKQKERRQAKAKSQKANRVNALDREMQSARIEPEGEYMDPDQALAGGEHYQQSFAARQEQSANYMSPDNL